MTLCSQIVADVSEEDAQVQLVPDSHSYIPGKSF
jgi:hypothetical protein